jgi:hypothetical protein
VSEDDARHGTRRGYYAHRKAGQTACDPCKRAAAAAEARYAWLRAQGKKSRLDPTGVRRRIQALVAIGYTWERIDDELGEISRQSEKWAAGDTAYVFPATYKKVAEVYERLCMTFPPETTPAEKRAASRSRNRARRLGWVPPLAWLNIDDRNEHPANTYTPTDRATQLADLDELHTGISEVCAHLNITRETLQKWCERNGHMDTYSRMVRREFNEHQREAS